jgi:hypothetical protein
VSDWYEQARRRLSLEACLQNTELREYACTLLTAVVGEERGVFAQIGDGAIVYRDGPGYTTAVWPQEGEHAGTTFFLTNPDFENWLTVRQLDRQVDDLAVFTDGLQPLALHYASRTVHVPFFAPMFESLRQRLDPQELREPLRLFLTSQPVTDRTDDDTTLVLATRRPPSDGSP